MTTSNPASPLVLTLRQPWAWAVFHCGKDVENRRWRARIAPGTRLLIHAAAGRADVAAARTLGVDVRDLPRGVLAGMVRVDGFTRDSCSPWAEPDCWHWLLGDPVPVLSAMPCDGRRMLWPAPVGWEGAFAPSSLAGIVGPLMSALGDVEADAGTRAVSAARLAASMPEEYAA